MMKLENAIKKTMNSVMAEVNSVSPNITMDESKLNKINMLRNNIGKILNIPIEEISVDENIRNEVDTKSYEFFRLVESIRENGVLQSIVVEFRELDSDYKLVCVAGHRRILASKQLGLLKIPCMIKSFSDCSQRTGAALSENINREDLHCLDIAEGYAELFSSGWSEEKISTHFEKDKKTIHRYIVMANWSHEIKSIIRENKEKFSARFLIHEFVNKSANEEVIKSGLLSKLESTKEQKKKSISVKSKLNNYFMEKSLDDQTKSQILDALKYLGFLNSPIK